MNNVAFMRAALALARRGLGRTAPNPAVGALVVDERLEPPVVLGRGVTAPGGRPHAEAIALAQAGEAARGATLFVTLEPCAARSTRGFGPACTDLILSAGLARVVIAGADPSPHAAGQGAARLRAAGIAVIEGVLRAEAEALNAGHITRVNTGRPHVLLKLARTADGFAGTPERRAIAITGEEARSYVHRLRASCDAILTGIGTVLADDPRLDCRLPGMAACSPLRIVLDTHGRFPTSARMLGGPPVVVATAAPERLAAHGPGIEIMPVPRGADGALDLAATLAALGARGITRLMVEAGPTLANALARAALVDELVLFTGPAQAGQGLVAIGPDLAQWIARASLLESRTIGADALQRFEA